MDFVTKKIGKFKLINVKNKVLDETIVRKLYNQFKKNNFAINCNCIQAFKDKSIIELIHSLNIPLIISTPQLICQASLLAQEKFPQVYINDFDCINNKRMLVKRRFKVV